MPKISKSKTQCKACNDTGINSKGGICYPCSKNFILFPEVLALPDIPKQLWGMNVEDYLTEAEWSRIKKEAEKTNNKKCLSCGAKFSFAKNIQKMFHHIFEVNGLTNTVTYKKTIVICNLCHYYARDQQLEVMYKNREIPREWYLKVLAHGDLILNFMKLSKVRLLTNKKAKWNSWRLVINKKRIPPKYSSYSKWLKHYKKC